MTARELITACAARGVELRVDEARSGYTTTRKLVVASGALTAEECAFLRVPANARAVVALLELDAVRQREAEAREQEQRRQQTEEEQRLARERKWRRVELLATLDDARVEALAAAGKLTAKDVALWHEAREVVARGVARNYGGMQISIELRELADKQ